MPSGDTLTLVRYNGSSHAHRNKIEGEAVDFICHIHKATERYIKAGMKAESYAEKTELYSTLEGALHQLMLDCNISGIETKPDEPDFFT